MLIELVFGNRITTLYSSGHRVEASVLNADAVIGRGLVPGASAPGLVTRGMVARMKTGSVVLYVAIDQGGYFRTSHATTHTEPTSFVDGVVHYCAASMPGAVSRASTFALRHAIALADKQWKRALAQHRHLKAGLNLCEVCVPKKALGYECMPADQLLD